MTSSSVGRDSDGFIRPLILSDFIKGSYFTATSGTASIFPYASTTGFSVSGNAFFSTTANTKVIVGTTTGLSPFNVFAPTTALGIESISSATLGSGSGGGIAARTSKVPTAANQRLGGIFFGSNNSVTQTSTAGIFGWSAEAFTPSTLGSYLTFEVAPIGSGPRVERLRVDSTGNIGIGTTTPYGKLSVDGRGIFNQDVRADYFTATSTSQASTFPYASTTGLNVGAANLHEDSGTLISDSILSAPIIGIGTTTPYGKLTVNGTIYSTTPWTGVTSLPATIVPPGGDSNILFWDSTKGALWAQEVESNITTASIGNASAAFGEDNRSSGYASFSAGKTNTASGSYSATFGRNNIASADSAASFGESNQATGTDSLTVGISNKVGGAYSFAVGNSNKVYSATDALVFGNSNEIWSGASDSMAIGNNNIIDFNAYDNVLIGDGNFAHGTGGLLFGTSNDFSAGKVDGIALGTYLTVAGNESMAIGEGADINNRLVNSQADSLYVGFKSNLPTLVITPASGVGTLGKVGIGTTTPGAILGIQGQVLASYFTAASTTGSNIASTFPYASSTSISVSGTASTSNLRVSNIATFSNTAAPAASASTTKLYSRYDSTNGISGLYATLEDGSEVGLTGGGGGCTTFNCISSAVANTPDASSTIIYDSTISQYASRQLGFADIFKGFASVAQGGLGQSTTPSYGQIPMGNNSSGYTLSATSTLGLVSKIGNETIDGLKTFTTLPQSSVTPSNNNDFVTLGYISGLGLSQKYLTAVAAATTTNLTLSGIQTIDGVAGSSGQRILASAQTTVANSGCYTQAAGAWTRCTDYDAAAEVTQGTSFPVTGGTVNSGAIFIMSSPNVSILGTDAITFTKYTPPVYTGTAPISISGTTISLNDAGVTLAKLANLAYGTIIGRTTNSTGVPEAISTSTYKGMLAISQADVSGLTTASSPTFTGLTLSGQASAGCAQFSSGGVLSSSGVACGTGSGGSGGSGSVTGTPTAVATTSIISSLSTASASFSDVTNASFTIGANEAWTYRISLGATINGSSDIQFQIVAPSGAACSIKAGATADTSSAVGDNSTRSTAASSNCSSPVSLLYSNGTHETQIFVDGIIQNGATPGTVKLQWANVSGVNNENIRGGLVQAISTTTTAGGTINSGTAGQFPYYASAGTTLSATSSIFITPLGKVGIGTTTPNWLLQLAGTRPLSVLSDTAAGTNAKHWFTSSQGGNFYIGTSSDNLAATSTYLTLANGGNVGIGTTTPRAKVEVSNGLIQSGVNSALIIDSFYNANNIGQSIDFTYNGKDYPTRRAVRIGAMLQNNPTNNGELAFFTSPEITTTDGIERLRITGGGNVGVGTSTPGALFSVQGLDLASQYSAYGTSASSFPYASSTSLSSTGAAYFGTSNTGAVNIGTTTGLFATNLNSYKTFTTTIGDNYTANIFATAEDVAGTTTALNVTAKMVADTAGVGTRVGVHTNLPNTAVAGSPVGTGWGVYSEVSNNFVNPWSYGGTGNTWIGGRAGIGTTTLNNDLNIRPSADGNGITLDGRTSVSAGITFAISSTTDGSIGVAGVTGGFSNIAAVGDVVARAINSKNLILTASAGGNVYVGTGSNGSDDTKKLTVLNNGNVGIGETSPGQKLSVISSSPASPYSGINLGTAGTGDYTAYTIGRTSQDGYWGVAGATDHWLGGTSAGDTVFFGTGKLFLGANTTVGGTYTMVLNSSKVGILKASPSTALDTFGTASSTNLVVNGTANILSTLTLKGVSEELGTGSLLCIESSGVVTKENSTTHTCTAAASPFFTLYKDGKQIEDIEFSANLNSKDKADYQSFNLANWNTGNYEVVINNRKNETDYIDLVQVVLYGTYGDKKEGQLMYHTIDVNVPGLHTQDNHGLKLEKGDKQVVKFENIPKGFMVTSATLRTYGYYIPYPTK